MWHFCNSLLKHGQSLGALEWLVAISCLYLVFFVYVRATGANRH